MICPNNGRQMPRKHPDYTKTGEIELEDQSEPVYGAFHIFSHLVITMLKVVYNYIRGFRKNGN